MSQQEYFIKLFCAVGALFYAVVYIVDGGERLAAKAACLSLFAVALLGAGGCVNAFTVRNPFSDAKVERIYQSTSAAACASIVVAFPQMMSDCPSDYGAYLPFNILTVPLGCLCLVDAVVEGVADTVCLPFDYPMSRYRRRKEDAWRLEDIERRAVHRAEVQRTQPAE